MIKRKLLFFLEGLAFPVGCALGVFSNWVALQWVSRVFFSHGGFESAFLIVALPVAGIVCGTLAKWWAQSLSDED